VDEIAGLVKLEHRRRSLVALVRPHGGRTLQDPGVAALVDRHARHLAPHVFARQLGPGRVDLELRDLAGLRGRGICSLAREHDDSRYGKQATRNRTHGRPPLFHVIYLYLSCTSWIATRPDAEFSLFIV
jgi:hypothetical protein